MFAFAVLASHLAAAASPSPSTVFVREMSSPAWTDALAAEGPAACTVKFDVRPDGAHQETVEGCAGVAAQVSLAAAKRWKFEQVRARDGEDTVPFLHTFTLAPPDDGGAPDRDAPFDKDRIKTRVAPKYPPAAKAAGYETEACQLRFVYDADGVPTRLAAWSCPVEFGESLFVAGEQWRFNPIVQDGAPQAGVFQLKVSFQLK